MVAANDRREHLVIDVEVDLQFAEDNGETSGVHGGASESSQLELFW